MSTTSWPSPGLYPASGCGGRGAALPTELTGAKYVKGAAVLPMNAWVTGPTICNAWARYDRLGWLLMYAAKYV